MPSSAGPNLSGESSLILSYDVNDVQNSFKGEPTTNLLPSATVNALPTYGNGWGTYNTNQYGSGTYFSIGTVSSVSSNIVTMTAAHSLRTYDVMQPQTTGGGVTAGTNYYIKKVSSTQFSLHEYNSSQDGSQGYINPSTGTFKVHDSIATDTRISINATSFPTMWWGYPHLPNSGLVKEIIPNGFTIPGRGIKTDCIRHHVFRSDGVVDGMAYGVDASFTSNSPVYISFYARANTASAVGQGVSFYNYTYNVVAANGYAFTATLGPVGEWRRFGYTFTSPNNTVISYWFPPGTSTPYSYDVANIQIEQKDHPTTFTTGTRSNTTSLIPLVGTSSIDVSNVSFTSNSTITFDGVNDYIDLGTNAYNLGIRRTATFSGWVQPNNFSTFSNVVSDWNTNLGMTLRIDSGGTTATVYVYPNNHRIVASYSFTAGIWYYLVGVMDGNNLYLYISGVLVGSTTLGEDIGSSASTLKVGNRGDLGGGYSNQQVALVQIYNRALTASEILNNFNIQKVRFNY